jgi:hypothetical protein
MLPACKKQVEIPVNNFVLFPIGQKSIEIDDLTIEADSLIRQYDIYEDECGGRWVRIAFSKLNLYSVVNIRFKIKTKPLILRQQEGKVPDIFLDPSDFIDSDHPSIISKSNHLSTSETDVLINARNIQLFVYDYLDMKIYKDSGLVKASRTLEYQYGTCINFARLFVALCRAKGIAARTVWGSLNTGGGQYNSHHNWAEFLDDEGKWHVVGLSFTNSFNLNDIRYLDLMYAPEENRHYEEFRIYRGSDEGDYYYFDGSGSAVDGKLGVQTVSDNYPDEMELSMSYSISQLFAD